VARGEAGCRVFFLLHPGGLPILYDIYCLMLCQPTTISQFFAAPVPPRIGVFNLRWRILRAPCGQPRGSEGDSAEESAFHLLLLDPAGKAVACGRSHLNNPDEAQPVNEDAPLPCHGARILRPWKPRRVDERPGNRLKCPRKRRAILRSARLRDDWSG
jgi:hypothetical protein